MNRHWNQHTLQNSQGRTFDVLSVLIFGELKSSLF